mmetsp:Transcript_11439/g.15751  ORF Transcript_11439/g.15751 Transcript_11439/m.15751 type:complete len:228 (+) Transcript_11439:50-733(+)
MLAITLAVICACSLIRFGLTSEADAGLSIEVLKKMPIKTLKSMIESKGLECLGCSEKDDYVKMAFDSLTMPVAPKVSTPPPLKTEDPPEVSAKPESEETPEEKEKKKRELDDLMASLKKGGFGNSKIFSSDDLKNMSPDEMSEKLSGKKKKSESKSKKSSESSKSKSKGKGKSSTFKSRTSGSKKSKGSGSKKEKKAKPIPDDDVPRQGSASKQQQHVEEEGETIEL